MEQRGRGKEREGDMKRSGEVKEGEEQAPPNILAWNCRCEVTNLIRSVLVGVVVETGALIACSGCLLYCSCCLLSAARPVKRHCENAEPAPADTKRHCLDSAGAGTQFYIVYV